MGFKEIKNKERGAIALIVALLIPVLLMVMGLVIDSGTLYVEKGKLQTAADSAALAAIMELPYNPSEAVELAKEYVQENAGTDVITEVTLSETFSPHDTIKVRVINDKVELLISGYLNGNQKSTVSAAASAQVGSPSTINSGVMPISIKALSMESPYGYTPGQEFELFYEDNRGNGGNWGFIELSDYSTAHNIQDVIALGGTTVPLPVGKILDVKPGNATNKPFSNLTQFLSSGPCNPHSIEDVKRDNGGEGLYINEHKDGSRCRRIITVPVIILNDDEPFSWDDLKGRTEVKIIGFVN